MTFIRNRLKLFWNYFWKNPPPIMKLQVLRSRLIPKLSKKSNKNLLFELCKVFEFCKMHFWPWKDQNRNFCQARMKVYDLGYLFLGWISSSKCASREKHKKYQKFRNHLMFFKQIYIIIEFWARKNWRFKIKSDENI